MEDQQPRKEETFTQTGRRGREGWQQGSSWRTWAGEVAAGRPGGPTFVCG